MEPQHVDGEGDAPITKGKRHVVVSACDACKRRKVKCSGAAPCTRCTTNGIPCTWSRTPNRWSPSDYNRYLEQKITKLEAKLRETSSPQLCWSEGSTHGGASDTPREPQGWINTMIRPDHDVILTDPDTGAERFYGRFGSLNHLRIIRDKCSEYVHTAQSPMAGLDMIRAYDAVWPVHVEVRNPALSMLPPIETARRLSSLAMNEGMVCNECLDRQEYDVRLAAMYDLCDYKDLDTAFCALVLAVLAVGCCCREDQSDESASPLVHHPTYRGMHYYRASVALLDTETSWGLDSLRAVVCQTLWLRTGCMVSVAYERASAGLTAALRMGYHVTSSALPDEVQFRRRQVISVLHMSHGFLASALGMPFYRDVDASQLLALRQNDLFDQGASCIAASPHTPESETLLASELFAILFKVNLARHPANKSLPPDGETHQLSHAEMEACERDLQRWYECLPQIDTVPPGGRALLAQLTLRYVYAVTQMGLYRPFLHFFTIHATDSGFDERGYAYASNCIQAAMQAVWVIGKLCDLGVLRESWFQAHTLAMAESCLLFFVLATERKGNTEEEVASAHRAHQLLDMLGKSSEAARLCHCSLDQLWQSVRG